MSGRIDKFITEFAEDIGDIIIKPILDFLISTTFKDFAAIFLCMLLYWGGSIVVVYGFIKGIPYVSLWPIMVAIWFVSVVLTLGCILNPYSQGISYVTDDNTLKRLFFILLGPIGLFKYSSLLLFFKLRIDNKELLTVNVRGWEPTSVWASILIEEACSRAETRVARLYLAAKGISLRRQFFQRAWKIATKRVEII